MYVSVNRHEIITAVSDTHFEIEGQTIVIVPDLPKGEREKLVGTKIGGNVKKKTKDIRLAVICNWHDTCGISTYTQFLVEATKPLVAEVKIFSEVNANPTMPDGPEVVRTWKRGESMLSTMNQLREWKPDFVIIQHEFGIFPKATYFLQMLQMLDDIPYAVTLHSVYEHLDKVICTSAIKNIIVHSNEARDCLIRLGNNNNIFVVPHGCIELGDVEELWNIFQTPYVIVQFGFGFFYKGVDRAIDAVHHLKTTNTKYKDIFYCYLCSNSGTFDKVHNDYYHFLLDKIDSYSLQDNVAIIRKFQSDQVINSYLRTAKLALFPYLTNPKHKVYGASGAIRVAMANGTPVIASESSQFDDLEGVIPRPKDAVELASTIDKVFSNTKFRNNLLARSKQYIKDTTWPICAQKYLDVYPTI